MTDNSIYVLEKDGMAVCRTGPQMIYSGGLKHLATLDPCYWVENILNGTLKLEEERDEIGLNKEQL